jgi:pimeloyl-ACP methyl ester carboxylesterase
MTLSHPIFPTFSLDDARKSTNVEVLTYGDDTDQRVELFGDIAKSETTIVLIHGGYCRSIFDCEHIRPLAVALAQSGYYVAVPEFRREAGNPDITLDDLRTALGLLSEGPLTLIGYSSGGHLALVLADEFEAVRKVIGLAPVTDLVTSQERELGRGAVLEWLGVNADQREDLDPIKCAPIKAELIIIQGSDDERVPIEITYQYCDLMGKKGANIEMITLVGTAHFEMMEVPSAIYSAITTALAN